MGDFQISEEGLIFIASLVGKPYHKECHDGTKFNCWTLTTYIYKHFGIILPVNSIETWDLRAIMARVSASKPLWRKVDFKDRQFLDIILFNTSPRLTTHIGVTIDKKWYIHATQESGVITSRFTKGVQSSLIKWMYRWKNL